MEVGAILGGLLCGVLFGTLIGGVFLRAAVALYNKLAGGAQSPSSVPEPLLGKAMGITFVTTLVNAVAGFVIGLATGAGAAATGVGGRGAGLVAQLISFPMSLLIMAAMLTVVLHANRHSRGRFLRLPRGDRVGSISDQGSIVVAGLFR
jgi:hypothetical protein